MGKGNKTKKAVVKRFRRTARGKVLNAHGGKSHLNTSKSKKRKRHLRKSVRVSTAFEKSFSLVMGK